MKDSKGVVDTRELPDVEFDRLWDRIFLSDEVKTKLVSQLLLEFTIRGRFDAGALPLHGIVLLVGPPGTGKTSLAKAIASKAASSLNGTKVRFLEVEPHSLTSSSLGKSQREITTFLQDTLPAYATGPLIVLLDEVETLAGNRTKMSLEANPIDVHRATDAVLAGLDILASKFPQLMFIATSNFEGAIDPAFISRADLVEHIGIPDRNICEKILRDTIETLGEEWPKLLQLLKKAEFKAAVNETVGLDGRRIRKAVLSACTFEKSVALNPNLLTIKDIQRALKMAREKKI